MYRSGVAYSISSWLPVTMNWVYTQVMYLQGFSLLVLADVLERVDQLPDYKMVMVPAGWKRALLHNLRRVGIRLIPREYHDALMKYQPIVLHSHFGDRAWYDLPMAYKYNLRHVVTFYGYDLSLLPKKHPIWRSRYQKLFKHGSLFLLEGEHMADTLANLGCPREKIRVHRLGVDLDAISFKPRLFLPGDTIRVLIAGRFIEKKGIPDAIGALGILHQQYPNIKVTVVGGSSGSLREEREKTRINDAIRMNHLEDTVTLLGFQPTQVLMEQAYQHHIFLSPSVVSSDGDTEGGAPVTIIEMLASGMPIVSTFHCDIPGIIQHGVNGLLAKEHQPEELAEHLKWLIEHPLAWEGMATAGRTHLEKEYNARIQGKRLMEFYETLARD